VYLSQGVAFGPVAAGHGQSVSGQAGHSADHLASMSANKQHSSVYAGWTEPRDDLQTAAAVQPLTLHDGCVSIR